ncbi:MAG: DUF4105 domain-containing protein [Proteobacteria bacterium]|nr:DUF4105 domain-containing protein [Pseudomonadota bacterium]
MKRILAAGAGLFVALALALSLFVGLKRPSNDREWNADQAVLPVAHFEGDFVYVSGIRNFTYRDVDDFDVAYDQRSYDLNALERAWFIVEPFSDFGGAAHTFVSFTFEDGRALAISVEIRKEVGEEFGVLTGMLNNFELMYVVGDERDLIGLRAKHREDDVFLYPMVASRDDARTMLVDMLESANRLREEPRFYNTFSRNCTTVLVDHVNTIAPKTVPFSRKVLFPGYSDELAWELGLLDTTVGLDDLRDSYRVNDRVLAHDGAEDFSVQIRADLPAPARP